MLIDKSKHGLRISMCVCKLFICVCACVCSWMLGRYLASVCWCRIALWQNSWIVSLCAFDSHCLSWCDLHAFPPHLLLPTVIWCSTPLCSTAFTLSPHTHTHTCNTNDAQALQLTQLYNKVGSPGTNTSSRARSSAGLPWWTHSTSGAEATQCMFLSNYRHLHKHKHKQHPTQSRKQMNECKSHSYTHTFIG